MFRKLSMKDHFDVMGLLIRDREINDKIIDTINYYGYNTKHAAVYGKYVGTEIVSIILVNEDMCMVYTLDEINPNYIQCISKLYDIKSIAGHKESVSNIQDVFQEYDIWDTVMSVMQYRNRVLQKELCEKVRRVEHRDYKLMFDYYKSVFKEKIKFTDKDVKRLYKNQLAIGYCIKDGEKIVSSAEFYPSVTRYMSIMGVGTIDGYRRKGYSTQCVSRVCHEIASFSKIPILRWENIEAGEMYHKLGFVDCGEYRVVTKRLD